MSKRITIRDKDGNIIAVQEVEEEGDFGYVSDNESNKIIMAVVFILGLVVYSFFSDSSDKNRKGGYSHTETENQLNQSSEATESSDYSEHEKNIEDKIEVDVHDKNAKIIRPDKNTINKEKNNNSTNSLEENQNLHQASEYIFFGKKIIKPQDGPEIEAISYFKNSMVRDMGFVYVEIRTNLNSNYGPIANGSSKASVIYTNQYDCQLMRVKTNSVKAYDNFNGTGSEIEPPKFKDSWGPIDDFINVVKQKICIS